MAVKIIEVKRKEKWERFVLSHPLGSFLQSSNWGETNLLMGNKVFRLGLSEEGKLFGVALVLKILARRGSYLECPAGPLIPWERLLGFDTLLDHLKLLAQKENARFIRIRPPLLDTAQNFEIFQKRGFRPAPTHVHAETSWILDINPREEELLLGMRKTTRNLIRKAQKEGVEIKKSQDAADVDILFDLHREAARRHQFVPFPKKQFESQFQAFLPGNKTNLFLASYKGQVLACAMIVFYGQEAVYHYGASSNLYPKIPASYLLLWEAIREAKKRKLARFNFWGIAKREDPSHPWWGLTFFKKGFGGQRVDFLHAQDLPLSRLYWLTFAFETLRRVKRGL